MAPISSSGSHDNKKKPRTLVRGVGHFIAIIYERNRSYQSHQYSGYSDYHHIHISSSISVLNFFVQLQRTSYMLAHYCLFVKLPPSHKATDGQAEN